MLIIQTNRRPKRDQKRSKRPLLWKYEKCLLKVWWFQDDDDEDDSAVTVFSPPKLKSETSKGHHGHHHPSGPITVVASRARVDPDSGLADQASVLEEGNTVWEADLAFLDLTTNSDKYYKLQALTAKDNSAFWLELPAPFTSLIDDLSGVCNIGDGRGPRVSSTSMHVTVKKMQKQFLRKNS